MNSAIRFISPVFALLMGIAVVGLVSLLGKHISIPQWLFLFIAFLLYNVLLYFTFGDPTLLKKVFNQHSILNFVFGVVIGIVPAALTFYICKLGGDPAVASFQSVSLYGAIATFFIVFWEELWFRGVVLLYASKKYGEVISSVLFSALFVLIHIFNPNMNLLEQAPQLFFAGATLSFAFFLFKGIWAPLGMHFANNYLESFISYGESTNKFYHWIYTTIVAVEFSILLYFLLRRKDTPW